MRKRLKNRTRQLPAELPLGNPSWLTGALLHRVAAGLVVASILLPLLFFFTTTVFTRPAAPSSGIFLPLLAFFVGMVWLAFAIRKLRIDSLDSKERTISSLSSLLIFAGFIGAWQGVSNLSFWVGAAVFSLGVAGLFYVIASYREANRWMTQIWSHENTSWKISEERTLSGWEDLPKLVHSHNNEMFDTLLLRYEEDPGDDAPYRQANKKVPYAKVPFEPELTTRLFHQAIGLQLIKLAAALCLLIPLSYRTVETHTISEEFCTTAGFVDILETDHGLFTMTQDGRLLLTRQDHQWKTLPSHAPDNTQVSGIWGLQDSLFLVALTDGASFVYRVDLNTGEWHTLYQTTEVLNDLYGDVYDSEVTAIIAGGTNGFIVRSMDGGKTWRQEESNTTKTIYAIWGNRIGGFYAVGSEGLVLKNNAAEWEVQEMDTTAAFVSIWGGEAAGKGEGLVYAVTDTGVIMFRSGKSWNRFDNFFKFHPSGVFGTVDTSSKAKHAQTKDIYVVGQQGVIKRHNGFGWSPMNSGTGMALWGGLVNDEGIFVIGSNGSLLFSDNDGKSFEPLISPFDSFMRCSLF